MILISLLDWENEEERGREGGKEEESGIIALVGVGEVYMCVCMVKRGFRERVDAKDGSKLVDYNRCFFLFCFSSDCAMHQSAPILLSPLHYFLTPCNDQRTQKKRLWHPPHTIHKTNQHLAHERIVRCSVVGPTQ